MRLSAAAAALLTILAVTLGPGGAEAASPEPASAGDRSRARLLELFVTTDGTPRTPASPRFSALREADLRGSRLLVGWILPELDENEREVLDALALALGRNSDGRLPAALSALGSQLLVAVSVEAIRDVPVLCVDLALPRAGASKELELAVLRAVSDFAGGGTSAAAALARRRLRALNRAVLEVHAPGAATVAVRVTKPGRHVVEGAGTRRIDAVKSGDTLAKVARQRGAGERAPRKATRPGVSRPRPAQKRVPPR